MVRGPAPSFSSRSFTIRTTILALFVLVSTAVPALAQAKPAAPPDLLVFVNGEQLTGTLTAANADGVTFNSAMAGSITVKWANIKELTSSKHFAVLAKNVKLNRHDAVALVPQGTIHADSRDIVVATSTGEKTEPIASTSLLVDAAAFDKAINHQPDLLHGWGGAATAGASLVRATQNSTTFNGGITLTRATPTVDWLPPRDRTTVNYSQAYGTTSQALTPTVKTNIFHAMGERDQYFTPRLFAFGSATFDHNFSQSLNLQQAYGGGIGISVFKGAIQQLDFKADAHYERQSFATPATNATIFGSTFSENFLRHISKHGIVLTEFGSISPAWNVSNDYSAHVQGALVFPVYKNFSFNIGAVDDYLNNAPTGSNKNSTQFTTGLTYTIKPR